MAAVDGGSKVSHREKCHGDRNGVSTNGHAACLMALGILESAQVAETEEGSLGPLRGQGPACSRGFLSTALGLTELLEGGFLWMAGAGRKECPVGGMENQLRGQMPSDVPRMLGPLSSQKFLLSLLAFLSKLG